MNDRSSDLVQAVLSGIPRQPIPDLAPAVMARIEALPDADATRARASFATISQWLWRPRPLALQWRPAYAFAVIVFVALLPILSRPTRQAAPIASQVLVQFRLDAPGAHQVQLAGNFTNWKASVSMKRTSAGVWTVVLPLEPGVHNYSFVVDGKQWVADPMAPAVSDGFGGLNSQLAVLTPDRGASL